MNYAIAPDQDTFDSWVAGFGGHIDPASVTYIDSTRQTPSLAAVAAPDVMVVIVGGPSLSGGQQTLANQAWTMALAGEVQVMCGLNPGW